MKTRLILVLFFVFGIVLAGLGFAQESPYRGLETREIKSLSKEQIEGYFEGSGMGMGLAAELNNYPGPKHVLELRDSLKINPDQQNQVRQIFNEMHEEAVKLGRTIVEKERDLDRLFTSGQITDNSLATMISEISDLNGKLRFTHLNAHLKTVEILDPTQIERYNQLRGYGAGSMHHHRKH